MSILGSNLNVGVSICVLTYRRPAILTELLKSLMSISYHPLEIIVVDNDSGDETEAIVKRQFPQIKFHRMNANSGVAGRNVGISKAVGDIVITLDDDVIGISDQEVKAIVRLFHEKSDLGAICFKILDYETGQQCNWCHHYRMEDYWDREFMTDEITEGAVAFRKSVFEKAGLYPERFFISYEGPDLLIRMLEAGFITIYSPEIQVRHRTALEGRKTWRRYYFDTRNQIWMVARNYPIWQGGKYLARGLTAMFFYAARDGYLAYWAKGIWDGIRELPSVLKDRRPFSERVGRILSEIISNRPSLWYMLKQRVFKREVRL